jgi:hypothetical protein
LTPVALGPVVVVGLVAPVVVPGVVVAGAGGAVEVVGGDGDVTVPVNDVLGGAAVGVELWAPWDLD